MKKLILFLALLLASCHGVPDSRPESRIVISEIKHFDGVYCSYSGPGWDGEFTIIDTCDKFHVGDIIRLTK